MGVERLRNIAWPAIAGAGALTGALVASAHAQPAQYPIKPIEMTVPFGAGTAADATVRHLAEGMTRRLGVAVTVVNRAANGGAVAFMHVTQQRPDGYSVGYITSSISTSYHSGAVQFDHTAFVPVARVTIEAPVLVVRADAPWMTLKDLVEDARKSPGKLRIGNAGNGSLTHLSASALFLGAGASVAHVPFGEGEATANLPGSRAEAAVQLPPVLIGQVKNGELRVLAGLGSGRDRAFPDAPTATEAGYPVAFDLWRGVVVPKGTPATVVKTLEEAISDIVASPEFQEAARKLGFLPAFLAADEFGRLIAADDGKLAAVMDKLGLKKR
jgi:tripartite-type tricarboxylate transporter receptor subunit TctC